jgi:hypothetical protein
LQYQQQKYCTSVLELAAKDPDLLNKLFGGQQSDVETANTLMRLSRHN